MTHSLKKARQSLRRTRNFVAGILIGTASVTPVFAATSVTGDDWATLLLLGSLAVLGIGLLLRIKVRNKASTTTTVRAPEPQDLPGSIGQYRPHAYR